jgi:ribonuclease P protein component
VFVVASRHADALGLHQARLGLVVSRKVGCAVLRNRFKRLAREVFRKSVVQLPEDADIVLIAKHWSKDLGEANLAAEWSSVNERIAAAFERHRRKSTRGATC